MPAYYADKVRNVLETPSDVVELIRARAYDSDRYKDLKTAQIAASRTSFFPN